MPELDGPTNPQAKMEPNLFSACGDLAAVLCGYPQAHQQEMVIVSGKSRQRRKILPTHFEVLIFAGNGHTFMHSLHQTS
jgi:hypothetical protein